MGDKCGTLVATKIETGLDTQKKGKYAALCTDTATWGLASLGFPQRTAVIGLFWTIEIWIRPYSTFDLAIHLHLFRRSLLS